MVKNTFKYISRFSKTNMSSLPNSPNIKSFRITSTSSKHIDTVCQSGAADVAFWREQKMEFVSLKRNLTLKGESF